MLSPLLLLTILLQQQLLLTLLLLTLLLLLPTPLPRRRHCPHFPQTYIFPFFMFYSIASTEC